MDLKKPKNPYRKNLFRYLFKIKKFNKKQISFLDVGCGDGSISKYLIKKLNIKFFVK